MSSGTLLSKSGCNTSPLLVALGLHTFAHDILLVYLAEGKLNAMGWLYRQVNVLLKECRTVAVGLKL